MENPTFQRELDRATELTVVKVTALQAVQSPEDCKDILINQTASHIAGPSTTCKGEVCQAVIQKYRPPTLSANPWHKRKTIYLILTIVLLVIWIIIYSTLSQLNIL